MEEKHEKMVYCGLCDLFIPEKSAFHYHGKQICTHCLDEIRRGVRKA